MKQISQGITQQAAARCAGNPDVINGANIVAAAHAINNKYSSRTMRLVATFHLQQHVTYSDELFTAPCCSKIEGMRSLLLLAYENRHLMFKNRRHG